MLKLPSGSRQSLSAKQPFDAFGTKKCFWWEQLEHIPTVYIELRHCSSIYKALYNCTKPKHFDWKISKWRQISMGDQINAQHWHNFHCGCSSLQVNAYGWNLICVCVIIPFFIKMWQIVWVRTQQNLVPVSMKMFASVLGLQSRKLLRWCR